VAITLAVGLSAGLPDACGSQSCKVCRWIPYAEEIDMANDPQQKKQVKKKPAKTLEEKRAAKREKKASRR